MDYFVLPEKVEFLFFTIRTEKQGQLAQIVFERLLDYSEFLSSMLFRQIGRKIQIFTTFFWKCIKYICTCF